jgi:hypothetical protein
MLIVSMFLGDKPSLVNKEITEMMQKAPKIYIISATFFFCVVIFVYISYYNDRNEMIRENFDSNILRFRLIETAIEMYREEYGTYPNGAEDAIASSLTGQNPKGIQFIRGDASMVRDGRIIDVWGAPAKIECNIEIGVAIQLAGPNAVFGDEDDYYFGHSYPEKQ